MGLLRHDSEDSVQGVSRRLDEQINLLTANTTARMNELASRLDLANASLQLHQTLHDSTNRTLDTLLLGQHELSSQLHLLNVSLALISEDTLTAAALAVHEAVEEVRGEVKGAREAAEERSAKETERVTTALAKVIETQSKSHNDPPPYNLLPTTLASCSCSIITLLVLFSCFVVCS